MAAKLQGDESIDVLHRDGKHWATSWHYNSVLSLTVSEAPSDAWMPAPQSVPSGCPPGLEYLTTTDQVIVHQIVEVIEGWYTRLCNTNCVRCIASTCSLWAEYNNHACIILLSHCSCEWVWDEEHVQNKKRHGPNYVLSAWRWVLWFIQPAVCFSLTDIYFHHFG